MPTVDYDNEDIKKLHGKMKNFYVKGEENSIIFNILRCRMSPVGWMLCQNINK